MTTETIEATREGMLWREAPPFFDDLEIGDSMESSGRTVTEYDVVSFAALTGDWHPQHADAAWAEESPFGRRIAHGMLVLSYALGLLPIDPRVVLALRSIDGAVLKRPVGLGDTIRVRARLADKRELGAETGLVTLAVRIVNQADELVARMEIVVLWRREPERAEAAASVRGRALPAPGRQVARLMLAGKRFLITGVLTRKSIAFAVAREAQLAGAEVLLTGFGRTRRMTERAAARLPEPPDVLELDINSEEDLAGLAGEIDEPLGRPRRRPARDRLRPGGRDRRALHGDTGGERARGLPDERLLLPGAGAPPRSADGGRGQRRRPRLRRLGRVAVL